MRKSSLFILLFGFGVFCLSSFYLYMQYKDYVDNVFAKSPDNNLPSEVLGTKTNSLLSTSCDSTKNYRESIENTLQRVILRVETENIVIPINKFHTCVRFFEVQSNGYSCPNLDYEISESCLSALVNSELKYSSTTKSQETLYSSRYNVKTQVRINDSIIDYEKLIPEIILSYKSQISYVKVMIENNNISSIVVDVPLINNTPNTDGAFAKRYIEADGSRQLIFVWENGKYKTYRMSGAFSEYNPVGIYKILNKSPNAWSSTAEKWMPFWMAFTADVEQMSMLGFHSLVYWYPNYLKTGVTKIWEPESNIGTPRSTGCLRLKYKEAEKLYNWAKVGDWVLVHN